MKNILLLIHDDPGQEARFQVALDVCRAVEGHLQCLDVTILPHLAGGMYDATAILLDDERERESANRARLEERLRHEDVPWDWRDATGELAPCLVDAAGLVDLVVVNRSLDDALGPDMRAVAGQVLVASDKPVLAVPGSAGGLEVPGHAMVAWDGSEAATAALRASVPLLRLADKVTILKVEDGSATPSGEDAAEYLSRHSIVSNLIVVPPLEDGAGATLLAQTRNRKPDYVVMGGFGHSRLREALLGGVSRAMLSESPVPLFLAR